MPKITIAIPTYNRKEYLKLAIHSILAQTFQDFQIFVFDNHSDYDIAQTLSEFNDKRITLLQSSENIGNHKNFYRIYSHKFNCPYVVIFHDDDVMHPDMLEREMRVLENLPETVFVASVLKFVREPQGMEKFSPLGSEQPLICNSPADFVRTILSGLHICFDSVMYRSNFLENFDFYGDYGKWHDRPILLKLAEKGKVIILNEPLVNYRIHKEQDSRARLKQVDNLENIKRLLKLYYSYLPKPLSAGDRKIFYSFSTTNAIRSAPLFTSNLKEVINYFKDLKKENLVSVRYLTFKGMALFFISLAKIL